MTRSISFLKLALAAVPLVASTMGIASAGTLVAETAGEAMQPEAAKFQSIGAQLLESRCATCHDLASRGIEPGLYSADEWGETVSRMIGYGASLTDSDFEAIVSYLGSSPEEAGSGNLPTSEAVEAPAGAGQGAEPSAEALLGEIIDELDGRQVALTKLIVPPGSESMEHRHAAYLAVYVLSGQIESGLDGEEPTLYGPGDAWFESHMQLHSTFRNPSSTEPFVGLIFAIRDADHPAVPDSPAEDRR